MDEESDWFERELMAGKKTLVRESRWLRVYSIGENQDGPFFMESKFETGEVILNLEKLQTIWPSMDAREFSDFSRAFVFYGKSQMTDEEYDCIIEFIVPKLVGYQRSAFAVNITFMSDKQRARELLQSILLTYPIDLLKQHVYNALGLLGQREVLPILEEELKNLLDQPTLWDETDPYNIPASLAVSCLREILKIDFDRSRYDLLLKFKNHPNADVVDKVKMSIVDIEKTGLASNPPDGKS